VKLELWESVIVYNNNFWSATNLCHATLRQSVAGIRHFGVLFFCNLGTPKTVISNFVPMTNIVTPYLSPCKYGHPNDVPVGQKSVTQLHFCIKSLVPYKLSHDRLLWFFFWALTGPYPMLRFGGACRLRVGAF